MQYWIPHLTYILPLIFYHGNILLNISQKLQTEKGQILKGKGTFKASLPYTTDITEEQMRPKWWNESSIILTLTDNLN